MQIVNNALSKNLLNKTTQEILTLQKEKVWVTNIQKWQSNLTRGMNGSCLQCDIPDTTANNIINEIELHFKKNIHLSVQYCIWQVNSGINLHNDHLHDVGATIYLNETWDVSNGGIFLWKDNDSELYKGLVPKQNTMIINNKNQQHLVTSINHYPNKFRYTIQIWGKEND